MFWKKNSKGNIQRFIPGTPSIEVTEDGIQATMGENGTDNYLINGGMDFAQRIGTGNQTASASYGLDRWYLRHNVTSAQISRQDVIGQGGNSRYALRLTNVTKGAGSYINVFQPIETDNVLPLVGKKVTFSFLARKNAGLTTGSMQLGIYGTTTVNDTPANLFASTPIRYTNISNGALTTTFQLFSITCTVPSTLRTIAPYVELDNTPADGGYIEVKDAMLNLGTKAAPFKRVGGTIGGELALCQRYCFKPHFGSSVAGDFPMTQYVGNSIWFGPVMLPTQMRKVPVLTGGSYGTDYIVVNPNGGVAQSGFTVSVYNTAGGEHQLIAFVGNKTSHGLTTASLVFNSNVPYLDAEL